MHPNDVERWQKMQDERIKTAESRAAVEDEYRQQSKLWCSLSRSEQQQIRDWVQEHRPGQEERLWIYERLLFARSWAVFGGRCLALDPKLAPLAAPVAEAEPVPLSDEEVAEEVNEILPLAWTGAEA